MYAVLCCYSLSFLLYRTEPSVRIHRAKVTVTGLGEKKQVPFFPGESHVIRIVISAFFSYALQYPMYLFSALYLVQRRS